MPAAARVHAGRGIGLTATVAAIGAAIGAFYTDLVGANLLVGVVDGVCIAGSITAFEIFVVQRPIGAPLRRLPLAASLLVSSAIWCALIVTSLQLVPRLMLGVEAYDDTGRFSLVQDLGFSLAASFIVNFAVRVRMLVGGRVLANFLLGRYHRPLRESRVFMFLDVADSTAMAEAMGPERLQALLARFFFDIAGPIAEHGGETHRYIGDEVVVTWPLEEALADARCIRCVAAIRALVDARAPAYRREFGVLPRYRIGLHGGSVVASEIGDDKREIVYFGDTINTAARVVALCKEQDREVLATGDLIGAMSLPAGVRAEPIGEVRLRGKSAPVDLFAIDVTAKRPDEPAPNPAMRSPGRRGRSGTPSA